MSNQHINLQQCMENVATEMIKLGYSQSSLQHYWMVWNRYLKDTSINTIDRIDMNSFLERKYNYSVGDSKTTTRYQRTAIRALNVIEYFAKFNKIYIRFPLTNPSDKTIPFEDIFNNFIFYLKEVGFTRATIHTHERAISRFLIFMKNKGVSSINELATTHISEFILEITGHKGKVSYEMGSLRKFLSYLYKKEILETDFTLFIPATNRLRIKEHLPTIWEDADVNKILNSIDTGNPVGKRDRAIILLAVRLGLRSSDIKNLRFSDINWDTGTITIIQLKTKEPVTLPLLNDVGVALIDYLKNSRPVSNHPNVFLSLKAPYNPLSAENHLHQVLNKYINRAGITLTADKSHGMHSMRQTLASGLLKQGTPLPVISGILGHRNSNATAEYLRVDIEQLRYCALEIEVNEHE